MMHLLRIALENSRVVVVIKVQVIPYKYVRVSTKTPVIFMAGCLSPELIDNLKQPEAIETISKPFNPIKFSVHVQTF
jgi:hypothetical protein